MKLLGNIEKYQQKIAGSIQKYGCGPEHNFYHFLNLQEGKKTGFFLDAGEQTGILGLKTDKNVWHFVDDVLSPAE